MSKRYKREVIFGASPVYQNRLTCNATLRKFVKTAEKNLHRALLPLNIVKTAANFMNINPRKPKEVIRLKRKVRVNSTYILKKFLDDDKPLTETAKVIGISKIRLSQLFRYDAYINYSTAQKLYDYFGKNALIWWLPTVKEED